MPMTTKSKPLILYYAFNGYWNLKKKTLHTSYDYSMPMTMELSIVVFESMQSVTIETIEVTIKPLKVTITMKA